MYINHYGFSCWFCPPTSCSCPPSKTAKNLNYCWSHHPPTLLTIACYGSTWICCSWSVSGCPHFACCTIVLTHSHWLTVCCWFRFWSARTIFWRMSCCCSFGCCLPGCCLPGCCLPGCFAWSLIGSGDRRCYLRRSWAIEVWLGNFWLFINGDCCLTTFRFHRCTRICWNLLWINSPFVFGYAWVYPSRSMILFCCWPCCNQILSDLFLIFRLSIPLSFPAHLCLSIIDRYAF